MHLVNLILIINSQEWKLVHLSLICYLVKSINETSNITIYVLLTCLASGTTPIFYFNENYVHSWYTIAGQYEHSNM